MPHLKGCFTPDGGEQHFFLLAFNEFSSHSMPPPNVRVNFAIPDDPYSEDIIFSIDVRGGLEAVRVSRVLSLNLCTHELSSRTFGLLFLLVSDPLVLSL